MSAIGKKLKEGCFRVKETGKILGKTEEDILCPEDIVTLAVSQSAGRKYVTDDMEYQVILNQADTKEQKKMAVELAEEIVKQLSDRHADSMECPGQIRRVHVVSDLIPLKERW